MNAPVQASIDDATFRATHVGASEVAALFDASPYLTRFELWHRKTGSIATPEFNAVDDDGTPDNERIYWGVRLEAAIIEAACERYGYTIEARDKRIANDRGLGGHPDAIAICPERGRGILEIKTADWLVRKGWGDEPPLNYLLQSLTYQGLAGVQWGDVLVLVGGNKLERFQYDFRPKVYAEIESRVAEFWRSVEAGTPPKPDYTRDGAAIAELNTPGTDEVLDLRGDNLATTAAAEWLRADADCKEAASRRDAARAELLDKLGTAGVGLLDGMTLKAPTVKATPDTEITEKMVGQVMKGRKAYRRFSVSEKEPK